MNGISHADGANCAIASRRATPWPARVVVAVACLLVLTVAGRGARALHAAPAGSPATPPQSAMQASPAAPSPAAGVDAASAALVLLLPPDAEMSLAPAATTARPGDEVRVRLSARWDASRFDYPRLELPDATARDAAAAASAPDVTWRLLADPLIDRAAGRLVADLAAQAWIDGDVLLRGPAIGLLEPARDYAARRLLPTTFPTVHVVLATAPGPDGAMADLLQSPIGLVDDVLPPPTFVERARRPLVGTLLALAAGLVALEGWRWWRRPRHVAPPPPRAWALAELERLGAADPEGREAIVRFHFALADILRGFCGRRWVFYAPRMTTSELLRALDAFAPDLAADPRAELAALLEAADDVKFASSLVSPLTCRELLQRARAFVCAASPDGVGLPAAPSAADRAAAGAPAKEAA